MNSHNNINKLYGLIGYPLSHSFSQKYFRDKFKKEGFSNVDFLNFEIENINDLHQVLIDNPLLHGFTVTIPYKEKIIPFLDEIDSDAFQIGAVNTVKCIKSENKNYLKGYNTDHYGFIQALKPFLTGNEKKALILGNGGAAKAVIFALNKKNIRTIIASRKITDKSEIIQYNDIDEQFLSDTDLIINATPIGMWPNVDRCPLIPYSLINKNTIVFDLVYNPEKTLFMDQAEKYGAKVLNGLSMLELQAEKAWEIFNIGN